MEWIGESRGRALIGQGCAAGWRVAILHPTVKISCRKATNIGSEIRLCTDQFTEANKFIGTKPVGFIFVIGGARGRLHSRPEICAARAFVRWADTVAPVVTVGKASAGVTNHGRLDSL